MTRVGLLWRRVNRSQLVRAANSTSLHVLTGKGIELVRPASRLTVGTHLFSGPVPTPDCSVVRVLIARTTCASRIGVRLQADKLRSASSSPAKLDNLRFKPHRQVLTSRRGCELRGWDKLCNRENWTTYCVALVVILHDGRTSCSARFAPT